ncbi:MAG: NADPH:quinone oxidoreductase family protein [Kineosporiaceae bacterium]
MSAWQVGELGDPVDALRLVETPVPRPGPGQVLVEVFSAALNFPDLLLARGQYQERPSLPFTPGIEFCGIVVAVGRGVDPHRAGERVVGVAALPHGAFARYAVAAASDALPAPPGLDDVAASAFLISYQTAWFGLYRRAGLRVGETLLVHAAVGGVGSAAVQLGRAAGAKIIAVVGGPFKAMAAQEIGADVVIDRTRDDVVGVVKAATGGRGADVVFDPVGGPSYDVSTKAIAFEGRIVVVGFASGVVPQPPLSHVLVQNYSILGLHWGLYRVKDPELIRRCHDELMGLVSAGAVQPLVADHLPFADIPAGLARLAAGNVVGRLTAAPPPAGG